MAKKRRVRSKKTGVEEEPATRKGRPKGSGGPLRLPGIGASSDEDSAAEEIEEGWETKKRGTKSRGVVGKKVAKTTNGKRTRGPGKAKGKGKAKQEESESESEEDEEELEGEGEEEEEEEEEDRPSKAKRQKLTRSTTPLQRRNVKGQGKAMEVDELPEPPTRSSKAQLVANATSSNPPPNYPPQPYPSIDELALPRPPPIDPSAIPPLSSTSHSNGTNAEYGDSEKPVDPQQEASVFAREKEEDLYDDEQDAEGEIDAEGVDDDDVEMNDVTAQAQPSKDEEMNDVVDEDEQLPTQADEATTSPPPKNARGSPKKKNVTAAKKKAAARKPVPAAPRPTSNEPTPPPPNDNDDSPPPAVPIGGRRTRASLAAADPSKSRAAPPSTKSTKGGKGGKGKKTGGVVPANAGLVSPGEATAEKQAIQGQPEEKVVQEGERMHLDELKAAEIAAGGDGVGESEEVRTEQVKESINMVRQEAPKLKSRGGGWYHPARAAEDAKKKQEEEDQQQAASEEMRRGGVGVTPSTPSSAVYALPRPPHLSNILDGEPASSTPAEPGRASSHPADFYPPQPQTTQYGSSPYPSTQAPVARTPQAIHHPQDAPNPYFSDPGYERAPYYEVGTEPAPRPYIHPAHAVPEEFFVPGATAAKSRQGQEQETSPYPVPRAEETESKEEEKAPVSEEVENDDQHSEAAIAPEDYDAKFAALEALVADVGEEPHHDQVEEEDDLYAQGEMKEVENGVEAAPVHEADSAAAAQ